MAKRFQFRLETLLRVRELREREAKRKVGAKQAEIARVDQLNRQTDDEILRRQDNLRSHQQGETLVAADLARERAWIGHLRRTILERQAVRAGLVTELGALRDQLREARTQKRIIEKLRERRWEDYTRDRQRQEQAESEELARQLHGFDHVARPANAGSVTG
jgi:flagellar FliJ protein